VEYPFLCPVCSTTNPKEYRDDNFYKYECLNCGKKNAASLRHERFEALFDFGSMAFLDGYNREAVANFVTSLERFFEFYVRTVRLKHRIGDEAFETTWNLMSKQSERQLGAFAVLYLLETGEAPSFLDPNRLKVRFRNEVVHAGKIPTKDETVAYADLVYGLTRRILQSLYDTAGEYVGESLEKQITEHGRRAEAEGLEYVAYRFEGMFGLDRFSPEAISSATEEYEERKKDPGKAGAVADFEYLKTDLGFEDALKARRSILESSFHRG
jgi:hypothetical protein